MQKELSLRPICCFYISGGADRPVVRPDAGVFPHAGQFHQLPGTRPSHHHPGETQCRQTRRSSTEFLCLLEKKKINWNKVVVPDSFRENSLMHCAGRLDISSHFCPFFSHSPSVCVPAAESVPKGMQSGQLLQASAAAAGEGAGEQPLHHRPETEGLVRSGRYCRRGKGGCLRARVCVCVRVSVNFVFCLIFDCQKFSTANNVRELCNMCWT